MNDDNEIEIVLGTRFVGIEDARRYAKVLENVAGEQDALKRSDTTKFIIGGPVDSEQFRKAREGMGGGAPPRGASSQGGNSPYHAAAKAWQEVKNKFQEAAFHHYKADIAASGEPSLAPLAKISKFAGWLGFAAAAAEQAAKGLYEFTDATSKATLDLVDRKATLGSSVDQAQRIKLMGSDPGKAEAFQQRITSDPLAMGAAGSVGIANLKDPYGDRNHATRYLAAIERVSAIGDKALREKLATVLGIEQEVARYALLSAGTREAIKKGAQFSSGFNDEKAQRAAAEFSASSELMKQGAENLASAIGQSFLPEVKAVIDQITLAENATAAVIRGITEKYRKIRDSAEGIFSSLKHLGLGQGLTPDAFQAYQKAGEEVADALGISGKPGTLEAKRRAARLGSAGYAGGDSGMSAKPGESGPPMLGNRPSQAQGATDGHLNTLSENTQQMKELTTAMVFLTKNIGLTSRGRDAVDRMKFVEDRVPIQGTRLRQQFAFGALG